MYSSHTPFPNCLHLPSLNKTCLAGDINSTNLLVTFLTTMGNKPNCLDLHKKIYIFRPLWEDPGIDGASYHS